MINRERLKNYIKSVINYNDNDIVVDNRLTINETDNYYSLQFYKNDKDAWNNNKICVKKKYIDNVIRIIEDIFGTTLDYIKC